MASSQVLIAAASLDTPANIGSTPHLSSIYTSNFAPYTAYVQVA
jgi:hypothetical protein